MQSFQGILPAVVTPFDAHERFDERAFETLLAQLYSVPIQGLYVNGQTGEGMLQPVEQRKRVAEAALRLSPPGKQVVLHVGAYRTADAVELIEHAAKIGIHAVSSLPPIGPYSFLEIKQYYQTLAKASDLPVLVYYFPDVCPAITSASQICELLEIPRVIGLKFTDFDLYKLATIKQRDCVLFNGRDEVLVAGMLMGADGGIGTFYNLAPEWFVEVFTLAGAGRWAEARAVQSKINELIELTLRFPPMPAVKRILSWQGYDCGRCLRPRRDLVPEEEAKLRELLAQSSFAAFLPRL